MIIDIVFYSLLIIGMIVFVAATHDLFFENKWLCGPTKNARRLF